VAEPRYLALWSYVRDDDRAEDGRIAQLHGLVVNELHLQSGRNPEIFLDTQDLVLGDDWRARLDVGLNDSLFLIPVVTPQYFRSDPCRWELKTFVDRGAAGVRDLILPLYYIAAPVVDDPDRRAMDSLAQVIHRASTATGAGCGTHPLTSPEVRSKLVEFAGQVILRWEREEQRQLQASPVSARVTAPPDQSRCRHRVDVTIEIDAPDDAVRLWLASRGRPEEKFHLHGNALLTRDRRHTVPVHLGRSAAGMDNRPYEIILLAQTIAVSQQFEQYRRDVEEQRRWPGLPTLLGAKILNSVQVIRQDG
jgi:TIR domain